MRIEYGYDRQVRSWNPVVIDDEGNIIESDYCGNLHDTLYVVGLFKEQYGDLEVVKIKAY